MSDWQQVRLHVVTGKGGTGKTTVATALALALAAEGRRVLLCEVEGRQGISRLLDIGRLPYEERRVAVTEDGGGELFALAIDTEAALLEYLDMFYHLGRAGWALERFGVVDFVTTIAPGLRDVLLTGKVYEALRRRGGRRGTSGPYRYDAVVLDAPPTGRITRFLNVNTEVAGLAKVGPIRSQADSIMRVLRSPQTVVHVVTLLEDMPVQETADAVSELTAVDLPVGGIIVNQVRRTPLDAPARKSIATGSLPVHQLVAALQTAGLGDSDQPLDEVGRGLLSAGEEHVARLDLEDRLIGDVEELGRPVYQLPHLSGDIDLDAIYELARELREQGLA